jgi:hypothetical protein
MYSLEGYQTYFRSRGGDAPSATNKESLKSSVYQTARLAPGVSFGSYKKPTPISTPRGDYDTSVGAPTAMTSSEYLRKKYGDFSGATEVAPPPAPVQPQTTIMGTDAMTVGDLKMLRNTVDLEVIRLQNLRSASPLITIKLGQLQVLADNLADVTGRVERGEIKVEDVAIFPVTARQFLKTFRTSENVPELFDINGNSPASIAPSVAPTAAPTAAPTVAPTVAQAPSLATAPTKSPHFLQWLYENIQRLKWSLEADYSVEAAKQRELKGSLEDMEKRILGYSYTDTPMPEGYQKMFLERIRGVQEELNSVPE